MCLSCRTSTLQSIFSLATISYGHALHRPCISVRLPDPSKCHSGTHRRNVQCSRRLCSSTIPDSGQSSSHHCTTRLTLSQTSKEHESSRPYDYARTARFFFFGFTISMHSIGDRQGPAHSFSHSRSRDGSMEYIPRNSFSA